MNRLLIASFAVASTLIGSTIARAEIIEDIPEGTIAYWSFDPGRFQSAIDAQAGRDALLGLLRVALVSGAAGDEDETALLQIALAAAEAGAWPHTLALLDLRISDPETGPPELQALQVVLEVKSPEDHGQLLRSMQAILLGDDDGAEGAQEAFDLPGGHRAVRYTRPDWPAWREVSWTSRQGAFVVGLGRGALSRWFSGHSDAAASPGRWLVHRDEAGIGLRRNGLFLEGFVDLNRVRRDAPRLFLEGQFARALDALDLANARDAMLHAQWIEGEQGAAPYLEFTRSWSARSELPDLVHVVALTEAQWPETGPWFGAPPGSYVIVMRAEWMTWIDRWLRVAIAVAPDDRVALRTRAIDNWRKRHRRRLRNLTRSLGQWIVISDVPPPLAPIPGAASVFVDIRKGVRAETALGMIQSLLSPFAEEIRRDSGDVWWLQLEPTGLLRSPAWGGVSEARGEALIAGWGPPCVHEGRSWIGRQSPNAGDE